MSDVSIRAKRYRDRAEECLRLVGTSRTSGSENIYLLIAQHYLQLIASEGATNFRSNENFDEWNAWLRDDFGQTQ
jgi:hypothetical protein